VKKRMSKLTVFIILLALLVSPLGQAEAQSSAPGIFESLASAQADALFTGPTVVRSRAVDVRFDLVLGNTLTLNLFDDVNFTAVQDELVNDSSGAYLWIGHLEGLAYSSVAMSVEDGVMAANVIYPGGEYQVRYTGNGIHAIYQIDQSKYPEEAQPIPVFSSTAGAPQADESDAGVADMVAADSANHIDVLVVYDQAAETAAGGATAMSTLINLAISETNMSYKHSDITQRLYLAHKAKVSYNEASFDWDTTLNRLTGKNDGYMDNVHSMRNAYRADEVVMLVANMDYCGMAWLMTTVSHTFESNAFALVNYNCATGYYSFGHELGHTQGARHDWFVDDTNHSPYAYNHGYSYHGSSASNSFRTVMAYNNECASWFSSGCTRVQWWSNPSINYSGHPTGKGNGCGSQCWSDNHQTLLNTDATVANFRTSTVPTPRSPFGTIIDRTPTYKWSKVSGATRYQVQLKKGTTTVYAKKVGSSACVSTTCQKTPSIKLGYATYKWRVRAKVGGVWKAWSSFKTFKIIKPVPTPRSPSGTITDKTPTYKWSKVSESMQYQIQLKKGSALVYLKYKNASGCGTNNCKKTPTTTLGYATYKWRVRAKLGGVWKAWSAFKHFTVTK
jgi:hypothetical protein